VLSFTLKFTLNLGTHFAILPAQNNDGTYLCNKNKNLMNTHLYLARHGQTQWNKIHRFQGQLDSDLTETGKLQSDNIAHQLVDKKIDLIVSSTLGRAVHTADICQSRLNVPIISSDELIERDLGHWQGLYVENVKTDKHYNELLHQFTIREPKNGESAINCATRIYHTLEKLAQDHVNKSLLVIFHGEALRCFLAQLGHGLTGNAYELFDNGSVFQVTYQLDQKRFNLLTEQLTN